MVCLNFYYQVCTAVRTSYLTFFFNFKKYLILLPVFYEWINKQRNQKKLEKYGENKMC